MSKAKKANTKKKPKTAKERYANLKKAGLCVEGCGRKAREGKLQCQACADAGAAHLAKRLAKSRDEPSRNTGPLTVSKRDCRSRFIPAGYSGKDWLHRLPQSPLHPARSMTQSGRSSTFCSLRGWPPLRT